MSFKYKIGNSDIDMTAGIFLVSSGVGILGPFPNGIQVTFFPIRKKNTISKKEKKKKKKLEFSQSPHTHKLHGDNL